ncbi:MAG: hypothetical protein GY863_20380 [bacterium]|nr:hypothetical protein [bacterium]
MKIKNPRSVENPDSSGSPDRLELFNITGFPDESGSSTGLRRNDGT